MQRVDTVLARHVPPAASELLREDGAPHQEHRGSVLRSTGERWNAWANTEPNAPPVAMMGPSAPNGPPVPIAIAEESGLSSATLGSMRQRSIRIACAARRGPQPDQTEPAHHRPRHRPR